MLSGRNVDVSTLCQFVASRRPLWYDKRGSHEKAKIGKLWSEVGSALGISGYIARLKWQNLRDTFRKEVVKLKRSREIGVKYTPTWRHFSSMGFLLEVLDPESWQEWKQSKSALDAHSRSNSNPVPSKSIMNSQSIDQNMMTISQVVSLQESEPSPSSCIQLEPEVPVKTEEPDETYWEPMTSIGMNENFGAETGEDADYHFLMSLLPYIREIPKNRKLYVRQKLQQVIIDEMKG